MKQISFGPVIISIWPKQKQQRANSSTELAQLSKIGNCIFLQKHNVSKLGVVI